MSCNSRIRDELKNMMEFTCPFCDQQLVEVDEVVELCCDEQELENIDGMNTCVNFGSVLVEVNKAVELCCDDHELENIDGMNTCVNCGKIYGYVFVDKCIDLYENMYKIRKKSVYCRKYHIEIVMNSISFENNTELTHGQRDRIYKVFAEI